MIEIFSMVVGLVVFAVTTLLCSFIVIKRIKTGKANIKDAWEWLKETILAFFGI